MSEEIYQDYDKMVIFIKQLEAEIKTYKDKEDQIN